VEGGIVDVFDLPESARSLIAAAKIEADSILASSHQSSNQLEAEAYRLGVDPSGAGYSPGDLLLDLARKELAEGRDRAAGHLLAVTAGRYLKQGNLDFEGFNAKLETISDWILRKYQPRRSVLNELTQHCRALALRMQAAAHEATEVGDGRPSGIAEGASADMPSLSDSTKRKLAVHWDTIRDNQKLTDEHLSGYDLGRQWLLGILDKPPRGMNLGGLNTSRPKQAAGWLGLDPSLRAAEARFRGTDSEYWRHWCSSGAPYETYAAWLDSLKRDTVAELASIWNGRSDVTDRWFKSTCGPAIEKALARVAKQRIKQARDVEMRRLENAPSRPSITTANPILDEICAVADDPEAIRKLIENGGDNLSPVAQRALELARIRMQQVQKPSEAPSPDQKRNLAMVLFGTAHRVKIVRASGTPQELRWESFMGGDLDTVALFHVSDKIENGDELGCDALDEPRVIVGVRPVFARGGISYWKAAMVSRSKRDSPLATQLTQEAINRLDNFQGTNPAVLAGLLPQKEFPRFLHHRTKPPVEVFSKEEEQALGPEWSREYIHQEYPKWKYHWNKKECIVNNAEEEFALGGGWADSPTAFERHRGPRPPRTDIHDPAKWVGDWTVSELSAKDRNRIKAQLLRADSAFWKSPDADSADLAAMKLAFDGIAKVLFEAGILTDQFLHNEIPTLVWDSAIAGGWYRFASETPERIFPERLGHYHVWRDESKDWEGLFRAETAQWLAALLDVPEGMPEQQGRTPPRKRQADAGLQNLKARVRKLRDEGLTHQAICDRLGNSARPPRAIWRDLEWPVAYRRHTAAVAKWLSDALR